MTGERRVAHIDELRRPRGVNSEFWAPLRMEFGITAFGINAWIGREAGEVLVNEHSEGGEGGDQHEELYFVSSGRATFTVDGDELDAPAGTYVFVRDPEAKRKAVAAEPDTTVISVGNAVGKAYEPRNWERSQHALAHWATKDWEAAIRELTELHSEYPEDAGILYNLACAESLAGRADDALAHLAEAVRGDASFGGLAEQDSDFDAIRDDPRFASAVARQPDAGRPSA